MTENRKTASGYSEGEWSARPHYNANCLTCGWNCQAKNAQGVAAQHARKHKHCIVVEVAVTRVYNHEP